MLSRSARQSLPALLMVLLLSSFAPLAMGQDAAPAPAPEAPPAPAPEPAPPSADDIDEREPVSQEIRDQAREHFKRGLKLLNQEAWSPALAEFLRSRELYPTRVATNNAAVALQKLQRYDEALDMFETLLRDFEVSQSDRAEAQKQIAELRSLVGTIDIVGAEPGASIVVSSEDRGQYPPVKPIRVAAGNHVVRVFKQGFEPFETRVDVAGGAIASIQVRMARLTDSGKLRVTERTGRSVQVLVDNVVVGKTPWEGTLSVGDHVVVLRGGGKIGSQPAAANVKSQELTTLTLLAEELESQLRIDPTPPGATVSIDGVDVGNGVWLGRLKAGEHKIEARAEGFLDAERAVTLQKGQRDTVRLELERDEDAPMWRKPPKWTVDVGTSLLVIPTFGGDIADSCAEGCTQNPGLGVRAMAHASYELGNGLGFGIELGYMLAGQDVQGRSASLAPNGLPAADANSGTADDSLRLQGFMAGARLAYHVGEDYPFVVGTGAGVLLGQYRDERSGTFMNRNGDSYTTFPVADFESVTYFYVDPGVRVGVRFADHWELTGMVQALMLIAISQPKFDNTIEVAANSDGIATYPDEATLGSFVIAVAPGANLRYDF